MKAILITFLLAGTYPAVAQQVAPKPDIQQGTLEALDEKNGFRSYHFGTPLSEMPQLEKRGKHYVDHLEPLLLAGIDLDRLEFYLDENKRLCSVLLSTTSTVQPNPMLSALIVQYGPPEVAGDGKWVWSGQRVTMTLTQITLTANTGYVGIPVKTSIVTIDTKEAAARRQQTKRVLTGTGF